MVNAKSTLIVLKDFFGFRQNTPQGVAGLKDFRDEIHQLSEAEQLELAQQAAKEMGYTPAECGFPLP